MGKILKEGFYFLESVDEEPTLVHGYYCEDYNNEFVYGFNTYDGGGLVLHSDVKKNTKITPVRIVS